MNSGILTHTMQIAYNAQGLTAATSRDSVTMGSTTYDEKGRVATQTDQLGMTVAYEYNNLDHVTREKYPDGTSVTYDYTCCGLPGIVTDRAGRKTYYDYDPMKRLSRVQDAKGDTLQMDYDAEGNLVRLLDGKGSITKWDYNGMGALLKKVYADGTEQNYAYSGGRLSSTKDARNRTTQFGYDNNGNLTGINYPNDADVAITYNSFDKPMTMTDGLGTTQFSYDDAARLTSVNGPWQNDTVSYAYDSEGRRSALGVQKPDGSVNQAGYVYDTLGRLDMITSSAGTFNYNYQGNTSRITQLLMPNGTKTNYSYTALGELDVLQNVGVGNANISRYDYNYDARGVRTALQEQIEQDPVKTLQFSYDPSNQLSGEQVTGGKTGEAYTALYEYDSAGNRTRYEKTDAQGSVLTRSSNNKLNQTTATRTTAYGVGSTSGLIYDAAGNLAQVNSTSGSSDYQFDEANRLKAVITRNMMGVAQSKTEFVYDGASMLRVSKTFTWSNGAWIAQSEKRRIYDGINAVQERDAQGALTAIYVRGLGSDGGVNSLLARIFDVGTSFMHYDGQGNVVQLTNAVGSVSGKYTYDAYGQTLSITGGAAGLNPYRFSTKELQETAGLYNFGFRFYSASIGKWLNRDPVREAGGLNLYGFSANNPVNYTDPYGLTPVHLGLAAAGAAAGFTTEFLGQVLANLKSGKPWHCLDWKALGIAALFGALAGVSFGNANPVLLGGVLNVLQTVATAIAQGGLSNLPSVKQIGIAFATGAAGGAIGGGFKKFGESLTGKGLPVHNGYGRPSTVGEGDVFTEKFVEGAGTFPSGLSSNTLADEMNALPGAPTPCNGC